MPVEECRLEVGALQWFYRQAMPLGEAVAPPVVLLHGLPSQSYSWQLTLEELAEVGFRAIAPDWIGFGFSAKPDRRDFAYTPEAFLAALDEWMRSLELDRIHLVVQGFLGSIGLQYAFQNPEKVDRLVIFNTPVSPDAKLPWKIRQLGLPAVGEMLTQDPLLVDRTLEGSACYQVLDADLDMYRRPYLKSSDAGRSLLATVRNLQLPTITQQLQATSAGWKNPTLVAWGKNDKWLPMSLAENLVRSLENAELQPLEQTGHYPQIDAPEKASQAILDFLRRTVV